MAYPPSIAEIPATTPPPPVAAHPPESPPLDLEQRVRERRTAIAFALHPTRMEQLMAVADAGKLMPPKSMWFEPKLADGLLSHVLD